MADTKPHHQQQPDEPFIESDGISYRGIAVFVAILVITTVICEIIVVGMFKYYDADAAASSAPRAPLSAPAGSMPPPPNLLLDEKSNLATFQASEDEKLHTYAWQDKNAGTVRLPIDRAKELLLERGLPVRK